jgi:hypothetical protein
VPLALLFLILGHQDAVLIAAGNFLKTLHVLNMFFVYGDIPEDNAHIIALRLAEGEDKSAGEIAPHVVWLDIGEEDVCVNGKSDSQPIAFPSYCVNHACEGRDAKRTKMLTKRRVKLDARLVAFDLLNAGARDSQDVTVGVPLDVFDKHASVDQDRRIVSHVFHQLHSTALVSNTECRRLLVLIFVGETLSI